MRSQIFIGSSSEGLKYVELVKGYLEPVGDCVSWTSCFKQNRSALDSLVKKTKLTEFAILIATCDDITIRPTRDEVKATPRDNIVFEFGLFIGATGIDQAFLLAEEGAELPSDLEGITISRFTMEPGKYNSLDTVCQQMSDHIQSVEKTSQLGLLPSTALAVGYYYSFIKGVCQQIEDNNKIVTPEGELKIKQFELHVIVPDRLDDNGVVDFVKQFNKTRDLQKAQTLVSTGRDFPFHFKIDPSDQDKKQSIDVKIFDVPTTLNTILESIKLYMPKERIGEDSNLDYLERRELENFSKVLRYLIAKNTVTKSCVFVTENVVL